MASRSFTPVHRQLTALRLSALQIAAPTASDASVVVRNLLAMQAQDYPGVMWSLGARMPGSTLAEIEATHHRGGFVRSWPMRGTLHLVAPEDLGWMLRLTAARTMQSAAGRHRQLELTPDDFARAEDVARGVLGGGRQADRADLLAAWNAAAISTAGQRGAHLFVQLAHLGVIVLAERSSYALLDEWVTTPRQLEGDDALGEFARRYFLSHGPATVRDFAWWSSLTLTQARAGLTVARDDLDELELDGETYYLRPGLEPAGNAVHLLPGFDEYILGYSDRSAPLSGQATEVVVPGGNGMFLSTIVVNGEVVGTWNRSKKAKRVEVTLAPFAPLSASTMRGVRVALSRYGDFIETPVTLSD